jgi:hypothetical protein
MKIYMSIAAVFFAISFSASAQSLDRPKGQGYVFFAPGVGNIDRDFDRDSGESNIHIGVGGEGFIYKGLGIGAEIGGVGKGYVVGLGSANLSYHFFPQTPDSKIEPFVTAGYSMFFRAGTFHGYNAGGGMNVWLNKDVAMRFEVRNQHTRAYETISFRIGLTFK